MAETQTSTVEIQECHGVFTLHQASNGTHFLSYRPTGRTTDDESKMASHRESLEQYVPLTEHTDAPVRHSALRDMKNLARPKEGHRWFLPYSEAITRLARSLYQCETSEQNGPGEELEALKSDLALWTVSCLSQARIYNDRFNKQKTAKLNKKELAAKIESQSWIDAYRSLYKTLLRTERNLQHSSIADNLCQAASRLLADTESASQLTAMSEGYTKRCAAAETAMAKVKGLIKVVSEAASVDHTTLRTDDAMQALNLLNGPQGKSIETFMEAMRALPPPTADPTDYFQGQTPSGHDEVWAAFEEKFFGIRLDTGDNLPGDWVDGTAAEGDTTHASGGASGRQVARDVTVETSSGPASTPAGQPTIVVGSRYDVEDLVDTLREESDDESIATDELFIPRVFHTQTFEDLDTSTTDGDSLVMPRRMSM